MSDIFDEVKEDLRAERARRLWARYGGVLVALLLLAALGVAGVQGWRWWENRRAEAVAARFLEAHRAAERPGADLAALGARFGEVAAEAPTGYRLLARLRAAALLAETGDRAGALAAWDAVAADSAADPLYRDLASLTWVLHGLDHADPAVLAARIAPLTGAEGPWRASARELQALVALRRGESAEARRGLEALAADEAAPASLRERAARIAAQLAAPAAAPAPG